MNGQMNGSVRIGTCASVDELMAILGGGHRMEIIRCLAHHQCDVTTIADTLDLALSTISQNLRILKQGGLVEHERRKTSHVYRIAADVRIRQNAERLWLAARAGNGDAVLVKSTTLPELQNEI